MDAIGCYLDTCTGPGLSNMFLPTILSVAHSALHSSSSGFRSCSHVLRQGTGMWALLDSPASKLLATCCFTSASFWLGRLSSAVVSCNLLLRRYPTDHQNFAWNLPLVDCSNTVPWREVPTRIEAGLLASLSKKRSKFSVFVKDKPRE